MSTYVGVGVPPICERVWPHVIFFPVEKKQDFFGRREENFLPKSSVREWKRGGKVLFHLVEILVF